MLSHHKTSVLLAGLMATALAAPAFAALPLPQPMHQGDVTYISGGIGQSEQRALEADARHYNLAITNADKAGAFTDGTNLVIKAKSGKDVLSVAASGPLLYAKLPPGDYTIDASSVGQHRVRHVSVPAKGAADVHLIWSQQS